jgi:IclR family KDG regulon transcriptional repressor
MGQPQAITIKNHLTGGESGKSMKAFLILDAFSPAQPELGVREVSHILNLPSSTVGRLMTQMRDDGILTQNQKTRRYRMSYRVMHWARVAQSTNELRERGLVILERLNQSTGETATLSVQHGEHRMVLERIETDHPIRFVITPGDLMPLHSGASGKIFLAFMSEERRNQILGTTGLTPYTANTITDRQKLEQELADIRQKEYAISRGERVADVASIAAPVRDETGEVVAAINISGPITRLTDCVLEQCAVQVLSAARELSRALGHYQS